MPIYKPALQRIEQAALTGPRLATLFEVLGDQIVDLKAEEVEFRLGYVPKETPPEEMPKPGEFVPEIILRLS